MGVSFGGRKNKGSAAERELLKMFWDNGWGGLRCAGSGSTRHPAPDILVSNRKRTIAFEIKATKDKSKYFPNQEIDDLRRFAGNFGAHPMIAIKFGNIGWRFINVDDLKKTDKSYAANTKLAETKGLTFKELLNL